MKEMVVKLIVFFILVAGFAPGIFAAEDPKIILVFVDLSDSTTGDRSDYQKYFNVILDSMRGGDRLIIGSIEKSPKGKSLVRFNEELPVRNALFDNALKFNARTRKTLDAANASFASLIAETSTETPIIDTLDEVNRLATNFSKPRKVLVLFSDMKEYSKGGMNFEAKNFNLTEKKSGILMNELKLKKRIADLTGVKVYVAGARDKNAKLQGQIGDFWATYFKETGADFSMERYGTDLGRFAECADCKPRYSKVPAR